MDIDYQWQLPCRNALVLTDRNEKWRQTSPGYLETNNCFIIVGLSHLMYACGLINQLRERGFTLTPINVK